MMKIKEIRMLKGGFEPTKTKPLAPNADALPTTPALI